MRIVTSEGKVIDLETESFQKAQVFNDNEELKEGYDMIISTVSSNSSEESVILLEKFFREEPTKEQIMYYLKLAESVKQNDKVVCDISKVYYLEMNYD